MNAPNVLRRHRDPSTEAREKSPSSPEAMPRSRSSRLIGIAGSVVGSSLIACVRLYQVVLSPLLGGQCRFHPSCSQYFIEAVCKYGPVRGSWKGLRRIARCHPFGASGYDPP